MNTRKISSILLALSLFLFAAGCKKKTPPPPPPPPPKTEAPKPPPAQAPSIVAFTAEPSTIQPGQAVTLKWNVTSATDITIDQGVGAVGASGSRQVFPSKTTTYTLAVAGPGGRDSRTATVNVTVPPPAPPPETPKPKRLITDRMESEVQDVYFDYDKSDIRADQQTTMTRNAEALKSILAEFSGSAVVIEGHADERGSAEYNLGLADRRATATKDFLVQLGVTGDRLTTISYGEEQPQCTDQTEECYSRNRRAHFSAKQ